MGHVPPRRQDFRLRVFVGIVRRSFDLGLSLATFRLAVLLWLCRLAHLASSFFLQIFRLDLSLGDFRIGDLTCTCPPHFKRNNQTGVNITTPMTK